MKSKAEPSTPRLRFPGCSGEWEEKKIAEIGSTYTGLTGKSADDFGFGKPFVTYLQIFNRSYIVEEECGLVHITDSDKQNTVARGDILFTTSSETPDEVGFSSVMLLEEKHLYLNSFCFGLRPHSIDELTTEFSQFLFRSPNYRISVSKLAQGSTRYNLSKTSFLQIKMSIPCPDEQKKIAAFLGAVDKRLELLKSKLDALTDYKRGIMQKLFSQQMRFTNKNGTTFPAWEEKKLSELASRISKSINPKSLSSKYQLIELENIESGTGRIVGTSDPWQTKSLKLVFHKGEVIFGKLRPYLQKYAKPDFDGVCSSEFWVLNGELVSNDYLFNLIQTNKFLKLANLSSGSKMPRADWKAIKNKKFHIPARKEQKKIAAFLGAIDKCIDATAKQISKSAAYKKGLLQQMFV